jgi:hypothetical protein
MIDAEGSARGARGSMVDSALGAGAGAASSWAAPPPLQLGAGSQQAGAGSQQAGAGSQQAGSQQVTSQQGSQQLFLQQPNRPSSRSSTGVQRLPHGWQHGSQQDGSQHCGGQDFGATQAGSQHAAAGSQHAAAGSQHAAAGSQHAAAGISQHWGSQHEGLQQLFLQLPRHRRPMNRSSIGLMRGPQQHFGLQHGSQQAGSQHA